MKVHKIASHGERMQDYQIQCQRFWLQEFSLMAVSAVIVIFGMMYVAVKLAGLTPTFNLDWWQASLLLWFVIMIPPIIMMHPKKPNPSDVLLDQALRRRFGMDDSVSK